jgi:hypothetical protein
VQSFFITKKIVGRRLPQISTVFKTQQEHVKSKEWLRENRTIREAVYFRSKEAAEKFIADVEKPDYCGKIFIDKRITKYAVYYYRKY